jgi:hypothetical protein
MEKVCVVVPMYKSILNDYERISLEQVKKVLSKHALKVVSPHSLSLKDIDLGKASVERFDDSYFASISGYNRLMLSSDFYRRFLGYEYVLIYQLDAFVFRDELDYWCNQKYDYIGAPWMCFPWYENRDRMTHIQNAFKKIGISIKSRSVVGNGGLSLRKIKSFYRNSILFKPITRKWLENEDMFWGLIVTLINPFFKVPDLHIAIKFSFEACPELAYKSNNFNLPFGCHAWERYDINFWKPFFKSEGFLI